MIFISLISVYINIYPLICGLYTKWPAMGQVPLGLPTGRSLLAVPKAGRAQTDLDILFIEGER